MDLVAFPRFQSERMYEMACVSKMKNPRTKKVTGYCIQFYSHDGSKKKLYGFNRESSAIVFGEHLDRLVSYRKRGEEVDRKLRTWLDELPEPMYKKLVLWGLVEPKVKTMTLQDLIDIHLTGPRAVGVKPGTVAVRRRWFKLLIEFFGADRELRTLNSNEASAFEGRYKSRFSPSSWGRGIAYYKGMFNYAIRKGWMTYCPFEYVKSGNITNPSRQRFIDNDTATRVLQHCSTAQERLVFCLSRYGALRIPSEIQYMTWDDIDFEHGKFLVKSPKKESFDNQKNGVFTDKAKRYVPLFPELRKAFLEYREEFPENGGELLFVRSASNPKGILTKSKASAHGFLKNAIKKAGLEVWPKLLHNLRSTRETELLASGMPIRDVCAILGHSPEMALKHYIQVSVSLFEAAGALVTNKEIIEE